MADLIPDIEQPPPQSGMAQVASVSWPASLTMLNTTIIKFVDGYMVSHVGHVEFGAQYAAGMLAFAPEAMALGLLTVVNTFVSQNFGAGRNRRAGLYAWAGMAIALGFATLILPLVGLAGPIFSAMEHTDALQAQEAMYFRYMIVGIMLTLPARVLEQFFFGIHRSGIVLAVSVIANVVNIGVNYVLIFGKFGMPQMGLEGAAIGSLTAWGLQLAILIVVFLAGPMRRKFATHMVRRLRWRQCKDLIRVGWPAGVQLCNDILCWGLFTTVLVGTYFGEAHLAATTVAMRYIGLSFMPAVGIGVATTAIVGKCIGQGKPDEARRRTHSALLIATVYMGVCGLAFWMLRYPMVRFLLANIPGETVADLEGTVEIAANIMLCAAAFQLLDAVGIVYVGALRGAGDTYWAMVTTIIVSWTVIIGGGWLLVVYVPELSSIGPWIAVSIYVMILGILMARRFESGAWRRINLLGKKAPPA